MDETLSVDQAFIKKLTDIILTNLESEKFGVEDLSRQMGMSHTTIHRKLRSYTHLSVSQFIRKVRLQKAHEMLRQNMGTISEISYKVGFGSPTYFNKCFHEYYGYPPGKVKRTGLESPEETMLPDDAAKQEQKVPAQRNSVMKPAGIVFLTILVVLVAYIIYPKIFKRDKLDDLRSSDGEISIAVMPFQNMTNDTTWNIWQYGIQDILINSLTNSGELVVRQIKSISGLLHSKGLTNYSSITPAIASDISRKLEANVSIYGSIKQVGTAIRLNAQIIDNKTKEPVKSFQIDGIAENIIHITDSLSIMVKNFLIISKLGKEATLGYQNLISTTSSEAYRYFYYGERAYGRSDHPAAINYYLKAIAIDSNFVYAAAELAIAYYYQNMYEQAKQWCLRNYKKRDLMPINEKINTLWQYAFFFETPNDQIRYLRQAIELDGGLSPDDYMRLATAYMGMYQYDKAIPEWEKALEIYKKWDSKPFFVYYYYGLGESYHKTGQYKKEKKLCKKAEKDFPDYPELFGMQATLSLTERDTISANRYIKELRSSLQELSWTEAWVTSNMGYFYYDNGMLNDAEKCFRQALYLEPKSPIRINRLAYFLIDSDRNIIEGLELADKALELIPDDYYCLHTKGWGLYKQGKYQEALEILQKSWDLRREKAVYNHEAFLHLEAAKEAAANQKNI